MSTIIDKHMPVRKLSTKERKQKLKPWITQTMIVKIKTNNKLHKKLIETKNRDTQMQFNKIKIKLLHLHHLHTQTKKNINKTTLTNTMLI